jgi:ubiquinone/menaquinone biosynthesis C-methylase UbiE
VDVDKQGRFVFLNYGYAATNGGKSSASSVQSSSVELYRQVVSNVDLQGKDIIEVGSGRGGGAAYIKQTFQPRSLIGIDLSDKLVEFCNSHHKAPGLEFRVGGAESVPLPDQSADAVVNVESSHCYGNFSRFLREVYRLLRPGGHFLYTDFRNASCADQWRQSLAATGLEIVLEQDITAEVVRALTDDNDTKTQAIRDVMPQAQQKTWRTWRHSLVPPCSRRSKIARWST